jgi:hypothetical protein
VTHEFPKTTNLGISVVSAKTETGLSREIPESRRPDSNRGPLHYE